MMMQQLWGLPTGLLLADEYWATITPWDWRTTVEVTEVEAAVTDFITLLRGHAEGAAGHGGYGIRAGLVGVQKGQFTFAV